MVFIVQPSVVLSEEDLSKLHNRLSKELNDENKHRVMCIPKDCNIEVVNDYDARNAYIVKKGE
jgi:hypothetical protein